MSVSNSKIKRNIFENLTMFLFLSSVHKALYSQMHHKIIK